MNDIQASQMSGRDRAVLTLLTWGCTNQQVADELHVSITTAKAYVHSAYRAIGVTRRTQAVVWGVKHGLATTPLTVLTLAPAAGP